MARYPPDRPRQWGAVPGPGPSPWLGGRCHNASQRIERMSLLQRVERAQQAANAAANATNPSAPASPTPPVADPPGSVPPGSALVPVLPATQRTPPRAPAREELLHEIRVVLQVEVVGAFDTLVDVPANEVRPKIEGIFDRVVAKHGFAVTRLERERLVEELINDVTGLG